ncbi:MULTISPECIES: SH3 domain-containing protein [Aeromonas]|uniref:SH3 domain-containing protein n=2 Tax=Aeromonas TaxID=642 RepID=UPI000B12ACDB
MNLTLVMISCLYINSLFLYFVIKIVMRCRMRALIEERMKVATERIFLLLSLLILLISPAHAKNCKKGQPCGNSCISWSKTCRINTYSHQLVAPSTSSTSKVYERKETSLKSGNVLVRYVIPSKLNVREKPNTSSYIATRLIKGDFVLLYKVEGKWAYISKRGIHGWVKDEYLSLSPVT